jgi:recombinational DNA repair protein RecR
MSETPKPDTNTLERIAELLERIASALKPVAQCAVCADTRTAIGSHYCEHCKQARERQG